MGKRIKSFILCLLIPFTFMFSACGGNDDSSVTTPPSIETPAPEAPAPEEPQGPEEPTDVEITGVTFVNKEVAYTGEDQSIEITGTLPQGVNVQYTNNVGKNVGTYNAIAVLSGDGYITKTLNAVLKINKATFVRLTFDDVNCVYDGTEKTIEVTGVLPEGTQIEYSCEEDNQIENSATETGVYTIIATITNSNYETLSLEATLTIKAEEYGRPIMASNGTLYFANALDDDKLYSYDGEEFDKLSYDNPTSIFMFNSNVYFTSSSVFNSSIKKYSTSVETIYSEDIEYVVSDGTNMYYVKNALTSANSGIFKLDISGSEPVAIKLMTGKAKYLNYYNGRLYFADASNDYKIYSINLSNSQKTLVVDKKVKTLTVDNGYIFYTVNEALGDYIENYKIDNGTSVKLTTDAGANLTLVGNQLYYVNIDFFASNVFGDGIYCVDAYPSSNRNLPGTKVFDEEGQKYSSLTKVGENEIAFYRVVDQMLCKYNTETEVLTEVLDDFVIEEDTPLSLGSKTLSHNGVLYYLDLYKGKTLCAYNYETGKIQKLTTNKVEDFTIIGDYLYYNTVSYLVNNDLYRINIKIGGEAELISTNDCIDIVSDGINLYYITGTSIHMINTEGVDVEIYSKSAKNLRYYDGYIYFVNSEDLLKMPTSSIEKDVTIMVKEGDVDVFEIDNGVVYYREVLLVNKQLSKVNVDGSGYQKILDGYDPIEIVISGDYIYFVSDTVSNSSKGIYKVRMDGTGLETVMAFKVDEVDYYQRNIVVNGDDIYFINYTLGGVGGDSHLYKLTSQGEVIKVA